MWRVWPRGNCFFSHKSYRKSGNHVKNFIFSLRAGHTNFDIFNTENLEYTVAVGGLIDGNHVFVVIVL